MRIGICDDNDQARFMVSGWLKTRPEVTERNMHEFRCGEALLEYLRRFTLNIVFLACKMEGMDGIGTAKHIRRRDTRLAIILFSNSASYARFGYRVGAIDYIYNTVYAAAFFVQDKGCS